MVLSLYGMLARTGNPCLPLDRRLSLHLLPRILAVTRPIHLTFLALSLFGLATNLFGLAYTVAAFVNILFR